MLDIIKELLIFVVCNNAVVVMFKKSSFLLQIGFEDFIGERMSAIFFKIMHAFVSLSSSG